ncbi:hypothetical protein STW0522ENT66_00530 [Enterobacter roggenkampii]|nr:hypothetical protein STW0522ENT66_00530 [Enterobacter roggenkampii]
MIGEIGNQVADIARTNGKIAATEAANEKMKTAGSDARNAAISQLKKDGKEVTDQAIHDQMYQTFYNEAFNQSGMGTGQSTQRAITAATAAIQALAGGDIKAAIAGGAAPYIANAIANAIPETDLKGRVLAHAVVNAALAAASGRDAASAAAGAAVGELVGKIAVDKLAGKIAVDGFGKQVSELSEEEKQTVSALATLASGLAGGLVGDSSANAVAAAQAGKTTVENNSLSEAADYLATGKKPEDRYKDAQQQLKDADDEFKAKNCDGLSAAACGAKMDAHRDELLAGFAEAGSDYIPVYGDIKSFQEADSALGYLAAVIGIMPGLGDEAGALLKGVDKALKAGDLETASKLINKASDEISGYLPGPGKISVPTSGVGASAKFSVTNAQVGKKLGKHVEDFGGNASNAADRERVLNIINDIGSNPDKVVAGKFAGQGAGAGASRGDVFFRIKGNDVVVTKPDGSFVTILKDGVLNNTSVKNALKGAPQ